jgi:hypothetical protein
LLVTKRSKIRSSSDAETPTPLSRIATATWPASGWLTAIRISRGPSSVEAMASPALTIRFRKTCLSVRDVWPNGLDQQQQGDCEDAANGQERLPSSTPDAERLWPGRFTSPNENSG